jgi:type I restriction enzyme M protein
MENRDIAGLCKIASRDEIKAQDWSLNPGRYVGATPGQAHNDEEFKATLQALQEELEALNAEAGQLQERIAQNVAELLGA